MMTNRASISLLVCTLFVGAVVLSGCSEAKGRPDASKDLTRCHQYLGEQNVGAVVDAMGEEDPKVSARLGLSDLAGRLASEAEAWTENDLLHDSYRACRISVLGKDGGAQVTEATVKWSVLTMKSMSEPKYARSWRKVNDQVFVEKETGRPSMRLLVGCRVSGALSGQEVGLPLEMEVADPGLNLSLRQKVLTVFARTVTDELACADTPKIPSVLSG
ncbi:hypothetical protein [Streptomyces sp. NBC_01363]|uniref:hypothetical protein n=1 Tax=Streptomyces sp. NBC_01363 TaxID=2903840 RepID=UPI00225B7832|nr:hypothetical protein [Streptomyces sp. NBC_01363]MCX4731799.1 hypothetical protein [Streptomyces sp. NBC_01363]